MSRPQKKRGFRIIVVNGKEFNWRMNYAGSLVEVRPVLNKDNKLSIDFGWFDVWLHISEDKSIWPPGYEPQIITPAFIKKAVEFALSCNWDIEGKPGIIKLQYKNNKFSVA